jgi:hypothetical protein
LKQNVPRLFEELVSDVARELSPNAEIIHDFKLPDRVTGDPRQIDVLIRAQAAFVPVVVAMECRDHARPLDVNAVEGFKSKIEDVRADKGIMLCPGGFTKNARKKAEHYGIDLYKVIDTDDHKWASVVSSSMMLDARFGSCAFDVSIKSAQDWRLPYDFIASLMLFDDSDVPLGTPLSIIEDRWFSGDLPTTPGVHRNLALGSSAYVYADIGQSAKVAMKVTATLTVTQELYLGTVKFERFRAFRNELTGQYRLGRRSFTTPSLEEAREGWELIEPGDVRIEPGTQVVEILYSGALRQLATDAEGVKGA